MNKDIFNAKLRKARGKTKVWWAKLNHKDRIRFAGKYDLLVGGLQERYHHTRQHAVKEIDKHLSDYRSRLKKAQSGSKSR